MDKVYILNNFILFIKRKIAKAIKKYITNKELNNYKRRNYINKSNYNAFNNNN